MDMIAKTFRGLEPLLEKELQDLGAQQVKAGRRMVSFQGDKALLYQANLHCRTALRILRPLLTFQAENTESLYEQVKAYAWDEVFTPQDTFLLETTVHSEIFTQSRFATYRVKDAIVDFFAEKYGQRPSISVSRPRFYLDLHISHNQCTISLDSSGEPLYKRGYRVGQIEAPINEVLAAGMVLMTGWRGETDFMDPMCGSGTIAIEAALIALNIPPGVFREHFAFEQWKDFDAALFDYLYNDDSGERPFYHTVYASDISAAAVKVAEANIKQAGLSKYIKTKVADFTRLQPPSTACCLVTNPPYGERIGGDKLTDLYAAIGTTLKHNYVGANAWIISSNMEGFARIGLHPTAKIPLQNGDLDCQYRHYHLFSGKMRQHKASHTPRTNSSSHSSERTS